MGWTLQQLADAAGVGIATVDRAESGECGKNSAKKLSAVTGGEVSPAAILGLIDPSSGSPTPEGERDGEHS